jgi:quercetin dioxygenase-like cupin family protein
MKDERLIVPGCKGTTAQKLLQDETVQVLKIEVEPGGEIPLHAHECAATMIIITGSASTLGKNGRKVHAGDVVVKSPNEPHGFANVNERFEFISVSDNKGIMREEEWDLQYI